MGVSSKDPREQSGTYYPSGSEVGSVDWDPPDVFSVDLHDCQICPGENVTILPSNKELHLYGFEDEMVTTGDGRLSNYKEGEDGSGKVQLDDVDMRKGLQPIKIQPAKQQGETISKGHRNYELMLNLQLGIKHAVGRPAPITSLDLRPSAFDPKEKLWTKFPSLGSKYTPPHQSCEFKWKDYCPLVFRTLRRLFKVDPADYMISICGNDALRELSSPGKVEACFT